MNKDKQSQVIEANKPMTNNNSSSQSDSKNSKRVFIFVMSAVLILALPILVYKLAHDWRKLKTLQSELSTVQNQSVDLTKLKQGVDKYKEYHGELKQLMVDTERLEYGEKYWTERNVAINKRQINRTEAAGFLDGVGTDLNSFFKTAMFDIQTIQEGDDLFHFRQGDSNEVQMTMDGIFYTKNKQ
jgi:hypothetical protein